ncbi:MAG: FecR domain-containing protein [Akkermansiaceae bacterium]|nr:FecR domain-containing protein [Akkermansiaceae bacterium]
MNRESRRTLASLLSSLVEGDLDDASMQGLEDMLMDNPSAQAYYLHYISVHSMLECQGGQNSPLRLATTDRRPSASASGHSKYWLAAAACLTIAATWFTATHLRAPRESSLPVPISATLHQPAETVAVICGAEDAQWNIHNIQPVPGTRLGHGIINLTHGRIQLDFPAGEKVTIAAPATFDIQRENILSLLQGQLVASVPEAAQGFTVITPNGAVVDLGTEFAVNITPDGENRVKVIKGAVMASSTNDEGITTWEKKLHVGEEVSIERKAPLKETHLPHNYIEPLPNKISPLQLSPGYQSAVKKSQPLSYWTFDRLEQDSSIADTVGNNPLQLGWSAAVVQHKYGGHLRLDREKHPGYATPKQRIPGLNTPAGCTIELWAFSNLVNRQSLASLSDDTSPPADMPSHVLHSPQLLLIERTGRSRSEIGHIHPDFTLRSVYRWPTGYQGGSNTYSHEPYLIHKWHHITVVRDQQTCGIYIDGVLSSQQQIQFTPDQDEYTFLLGRLHIFKDHIDDRQWSGAIDEVAIYARALGADEISTHYRAAKPRTIAP